MRLAIADPPYPPRLTERRDLAGGLARVTTPIPRPTLVRGRVPRRPPRCGLPPRRRRVGRAGAPEAWTHWVLDALGFDPATDTVDDLFPGSGAIQRAIDERSLTPASTTEAAAGSTA